MQSGTTTIYTSNSNNMRKLVAALNMTPDGFCDHTAMVADDEIHWHYTRLLQEAGAIVYGRITYQLMESYWPTVVKNPTGNPSMDEFASAIDNIPKVLFSTTVRQVEWTNTTLATGSLNEEVLKLKDQPGRDLLVGSRSMIVSLINLGLVDELQLCVHPVLAGGGLPLFKEIDSRNVLNLTKTKTFGSGAILLNYTVALQ